MKHTIIGLLAAIAITASTGCIIVADDDATLSIENRSDFVLVDIAFRTTFGNDDYGNNVLRGDALFPGELITIAVSCNTYDVFIQDEDGVACELLGLDLCLNDALWIVDNQELNACAFAKPAGPNNLAEPLENSDRTVDLRQ